MNWKNIRLPVLAGLLIATLMAWAATSDETSNKYKPDYGSYGSVLGVVIQTSDDAYNSEPVNSAHPLPITGTVSASTIATSQTNSSGSITVGGTFQQIAAASATRKSFEFHNVCTKAGNCTATSNNCYLYVAAAGTPGTDNSIIVPAGATYLRASGAVPSDQIRATCDGTGDKYYLSVQ